MNQDVIPMRKLWWLICVLGKEITKKVNGWGTRYIQVVGKTPDILTSGEKEERAY